MPRLAPPTVALCLLLSIAVGCRDRPRPPIRNVLLISIDTLRADHLSAYGFPRPTTPHIDGLARQGVRFTEVRTPVPMTLPAHVSLLTGTLPPTHGLRDNLLNRLPEGTSTLAGRLKARGLATGAVVSSFVLDRRFGTSQGFDDYDDRFDAVHKIGDLAERKGDEAARHARDWLLAHQDRPFFLFVHFYDPHDPYQPPEPYAAEWKANPYEGEIAFTDHCVGQLLAALEEIHHADDTLVVVTGDHGEMLGEHGEQNHGFFIYEGALRVPLVMRVPGLAGPRVVDLPVSLIDVAPTLLAQLGAPVPKEMQGIDLSSWMAGRGAGGGGRPLYAETVTPTRYYGTSSLLGVIADGWKYIETSRPELYDLRRDPAEADNLLAREPARADAMGKTLVAILAAAGRAPGPAPEAAALDEEARRRLSALGYLGTSSGVSANGFDRSKEDAKDLIGFFRKDQQLNNLVEEKNYAAARVQCAEMLRIRPGFADCHLQMSKIAAAEGDLSAALAAARKAVAVSPRNERAHLQVAGILKERGDLDGAIGSLRQALAAKPDEPDARILLGRALAEKGELGEAQRLLEGAAAASPESAALAVQQGFVLAKQGKLEEAIASYRRALSSDPRSAEAHAYLGSALANQRHWTEAIEHFAAALAARPENAELHHWIGIALRETGRFDEAVGHLEEAVRLAPRMAVAQLDLGRARKQQGRLDDAAALYRRALSLDPRLAAAHNALGAVLGAQGRLPEAAREFAEAVRLEPNDAEAHNNLGLALQGLGKGAEALAQFREALRLRPEWPAALNQSAWILATHGDPRVRNPAEAVALAERAIARSAKREALLLDTLAAACAAAGDFPRAAAIAGEAVALATAQGASPLAADIGTRLALYREGKPFREPGRAR